MTGPPRLALLIFNLDGGGAERVMVTLANAFHRAGRPVDLLCVQARGVYRSEVDPGVRVIDLAAARSLLAVPALSRYLRRERPAALLSTLASVSVAAAFGCWLARVPVRLVIRETTNPLEEHRTVRGGEHSPLAILRRWAYRRADAIVAPSAGARQGVIDSLRLPASSVFTIANPVDVDRILALAQEPAPLLEGLPAGARVVVALGRLSKEKDYPTLLRAFAALPSRDGVFLVILGEGPEREALGRLATELRVDGALLMPGFVANPFAYLRCATVFVLSSTFEGMPNTVIQALVVGAPVVATDCRSGPRELLDDGRWGRLVAVGDAAAMAVAIQEALGGRVAAAPTAAMAARHDMHQIGRQYLEILNG